MPMGSVPGGIAGAAGFGIGAGARAATRFFLGAALALTAVFFLAATFLPPVFLRTATLPVEVFFFLVVVLAFFLVAMGSTSTLRTENVRENDASFVNGMPDAWRYHAPSASKKPILGLRRVNFCGGQDKDSKRRAHLPRRSKTSKIILFADVHAIMPQNVVRRGGMEIDVGQNVIEKIRQPLKGHGFSAHLHVDRPSLGAVDLIGRKRLEVSHRFVNAGHEFRKAGLVVFVLGRFQPRQ